MKRPSLVTVLIAQTVLLFLVAWAGVYFARDEFLLATGRQGDDDDEGLAKAAAITEESGVPTVRLSPAAQRNVGIEVAMPEATQRGSESSVPVTVLDAQALVELQGRWRAARHEADAARAVAAASAAERQRVQALFDDDRNASQRALDTAIAQATADAARERAAQAALLALREGARTGWGTELAGALEAGPGGLVERLANGREVLLQAALRGDETVARNARLLLSLPGRAEPVAATPLGSAGPAAVAESGGGRRLLFHAAGTGLVAGQRLTGQWRGAPDALQPGVLVPASAVIWHAGQPWIYILETNEPQPVSPSKETQPDDDAPAPPPAAAAASAAPPAASEAAEADESGRFQRRAVPYARRVGEHWFLPGYAEDDAVVVRGAQLLLSEELKFQIRNENDD